MEGAAVWRGTGQDTQGSQEHVDPSSTCSQKTNLPAFIVFRLFLLSLSAAALHSQTGPGKYKQDAVLSDRKSPLVCSLAPGPEPWPVLCSTRLFFPPQRPPPRPSTEQKANSLGICVMHAYVH